MKYLYLQFGAVSSSYKCLYLSKSLKVHEKIAELTNTCFSDQWQHSQTSIPCFTNKQSLLPINEHSAVMLRNRVFLPAEELCDFQTLITVPLRSADELDWQRAFLWINETGSGYNKGGNEVASGKEQLNDK
jgi:hypothetical protein